MAPPSSVAGDPALAAVRRVAERDLGRPVRRVEPLRGGMVARVFAVETDEGSYVVRLAPHPGTLGKDRTAHERHSGPDLPVPPVLGIGRLDRDMWYALARRAAGVRMDTLPAHRLAALAPDLAAVLRAVHGVRPPDGAGAGLWLAEGPAPAPARWADFLRSSTDAAQPRSADPAQASELAAWRARFHNLCADLPDARALVHGDVRLANLFADGDRISAVIDWEESMYGDPLYDLAWVNFWHGARPVWTAYGVDTGRDGAGERLHAYLLRIGLRSLCFFEQTGRPRAHAWTLGRLREVADGPGEDPRRDGPAFFLPDLGD